MIKVTILSKSKKSLELNFNNEDFISVDVKYIDSEGDREDLRDMAEKIMEDIQEDHYSIQTILCEDRTKLKALMKNVDYAEIKRINGYYQKLLFWDTTETVFVSYDKKEEEFGETEENEIIEVFRINYPLQPFFIFCHPENVEEVRSFLQEIQPELKIEYYKAERLMTVDCNCEDCISKRKGVTK